MNGKNDPRASIITTTRVTTRREAAKSNWVRWLMASKHPHKGKREKLAVWVNFPVKVHSMNRIVRVINQWTIYLMMSCRLLYDCWLAVVNVRHRKGKRWSKLMFRGTEEASTLKHQFAEQVDEREEEKKDERGARSNERRLWESESELNVKVRRFVSCRVSGWLKE